MGKNNNKAEANKDPNQKEIRSALNAIFSPLMNAGNDYFASTLKFNAALNKAKTPGKFNLWDFGKISQIKYEKLKHYIEIAEKFITSKPSAFFSHPMVKPKVQEHLLIINEELVDLKQNWAKLSQTLGVDPHTVNLAAKMDNADDRKAMLFINQKNRAFTEPLFQGKKKLDELDERAEKLEKQLVNKLRR